MFFLFFPFLCCMYRFSEAMGFRTCFSICCQVIVLFYMIAFILVFATLYKKEIMKHIVAVEVLLLRLVALCADLLCQLVVWLIVKLSFLALYLEEMLEHLENV
ncbi:TPA_asm: EO5 [Tilapia adomavirus 2]|uniref:EO5 n=1 Tax=Tilapia adomavirus 2 TaxID=2597804 RepID=A0A5H3CJ93_9VIRU|nr:TPA_asm: EO5 [Tilapia adomavirus 2]